MFYFPKKLELKISFSLWRNHCNMCHMTWWRHMMCHIEQRSVGFIKSFEPMGIEWFIINESSLFQQPINHQPPTKDIRFYNFFLINFNARWRYRIYSWAKVTVLRPVPNQPIKLVSDIQNYADFHVLISIQISLNFLLAL